MPAVPGLAPPVRAVCLAPMGMEEGTSAELPGEELGLVVGEPVAVPAASRPRCAATTGSATVVEDAEAARGAPAGRGHRPGRGRGPRARWCRCGSGRTSPRSARSSSSASARARPGRSSGTCGSGTPTPGATGAAAPQGSSCPVRASSSASTSGRSTPRSRRSISPPGEIWRTRCAALPIPQLVAPGEVAERRLLPSSAYLPGPELPPEALRLPWGERAVAVGELARAQGARVPGRLVSSAKSWLANPRADRHRAHPALGRARGRAAPLAGGRVGALPRAPARRLGARLTPTRRWRSRRSCWPCRRPSTRWRAS